MGTTRVRSLKQSSSTSTLTTAALTTFAANIPVGDDVVIWMSFHTVSATACTASDNSTQTGTANTYTVRLDSTLGGSSVRIVCITCHLTRQIQTTDTITLNFPSSADSIRAVQYTGSSGFDAASTAATGFSGTTTTTNNVTTVAASGMLCAGVTVNEAANTVVVGTIGAGTATVTGSTLLEGETANGGGSTNKTAIADEDRPFSSAGTADATFTFTSANWAAGIISLADAVVVTTLPWQGLNVRQAVNTAATY